MSPDQVANRIRLELLKGRRSLKELHLAIGADARYILRMLIRLQGVNQIDACPDPVNKCMWYVLKGKQNEPLSDDPPKEEPTPKAEPVALPAVSVQIRKPPTKRSKPSRVRPFIRICEGVWLCHSRGCAASGDTPREAFLAWNAKRVKEAA